MNEIEKTFKSMRNIAIVGLSPDENKPSHKVAKFLQEQGFKIYPIYPEEDKILGRKVYRSLNEIADSIDTVVMFRKSEFAEILIKDVILKKAKNFWLQLGIKNENAKKISKQNGINFVQDHCIMIEFQNFKKGKKMVDLNKIIQAKRTISSFIAETSCDLAPKLSEIYGAKIYLKKENLQTTGAYKIRGAFNKIAHLSEDDKKRGVVAASAGNHAQGVAISAKHFGVKATIVMPEATPLLKVAGTKSLGAEVILKGDNFDEAYAYALKYTKEHDKIFVHPFDDEFVQAGQGTIALEMLESVPDLDYVVLPVGGGGLISGVASYIKQVNPECKVIAVGAKGAPAMHDSFLAKKVINSKSVRTIADGIAVRDASEITLKIILETVDEFVQVDDNEIANAILYLLEQQKIIVEGAGAAGVAALMNRKFKFEKGKKIGIIISGGNIDVQMLNIIIEKGLRKSKRKMTVNVTLVDKPGALLGLTEAIQKANANIVKIDYDRFSTNIEYGDAVITITLETKGEKHQEEVRKSLLDEGYKFNEIM